MTLYSDKAQRRGCVKEKVFLNVQRVLMCVHKKKKKEREMALLGSSPSLYYPSSKLSLALTYGGNLEY